MGSDFCSVKKTNRTHSKSYVEDLSIKTARKDVPRRSFACISFSKWCFFF
ncbi:secretion protein HlyD [Selenomonas sp. oral taxon 478]